MSNARRFLQSDQTSSIQKQDVCDTLLQQLPNTTNPKLAQRVIVVVYVYHLGASEESCSGFFCSFFEWRPGQERLDFACTFICKRFDTNQGLRHPLLGFHTQGARLLLRCRFLDSESIQKGKERALLFFPNFFVLDKSTALLDFPVF